MTKQEQVLAEDSEKSSEGKTSWVKIKPEELEKIVVELAKQGISPEKIGLVLRDKHGIPKAKIFGKKISKILKENNIPITNIKDNLTKKTENLTKHFEKNKHDYSAQRSLTLNSSRLKKLKKS